MDNHSCSTPRPPGVDSLLDGDNSWEKISLLFFVINILEAEHRISGSVDYLDQAIVYAEELTKVLAAQQTQLHCRPTAATAMELLMELLERKMDQKGGINHLTKLIEAARAHLELVAPAKPSTTLGKLGVACAQHYHLTEDHDILLEAIENLQQYLKKADDSDVVASPVGEATQVLDPNQARSLGPGSSNEYCHSRPHERDRSKSLQELYFSARLAVVKCLQEAYRIEKEADILNQLIFECDYSLRVFSSSGSHHREIQQILNFATMQRYFRRTASDREPQQFSATGISPTAAVLPPVTSDMSAYPTSLSISESLYKTHKLSQWRREVRLLELHPGKQKDPIICTLKVSDLDAAPAYDALSYCWGDIDITKGIIVDGIALEVTTNLYAALSRLRSPTTLRTLWVDAICIDQADNVEKMHQISLMRKIYATAREVVMWLGEPQINPVGSLGKIDCSSQIISRMKEDWPEWLYSSLALYLEDPPLTGSDYTKTAHRAGDHLRFWQVLEQLPEEVRPVFYGPNARDFGDDIDANDEDFLTIILTVIENQGSIQDFGEVWSQNTFSGTQNGPKAQCFDWRKLSEIPQFFSGPLKPLEWPLLGAMTLIYTLSANKHLSDTPFFSKGDHIGVRISQALLKSVAALNNMLTIPYWTRAWIVQEIVLAQNPTIYYGPHILDFKMLARAQFNLDRHLHHVCCRDALDIFQMHTLEDTTIWGNLSRSFRTVKDLFELWAINAAKRANGDELNASWACIIASGLGNRQATNPRDLIYGMLGLVSNEGPDKIMADYSVPIANVFTSVAKRVIEERGNLTVLSSIKMAGGKKFQLPSWVPDWSGGPEPVGMPYPWDLCESSLDRALKFHVSDDLCLSVTSTFVDIVGSIGDDIESSGPYLQNDMISVILSWRRLAGLPDDIRDNSERENHFWRILFANAVFDSGREARLKAMEPSHVDAVKEWWKWRRWRMSSPREDDLISCKEDPLSRLNTANDTMDRWVHLLTNGKRFFVTSSGKLATGWASTSKGDEIHVVDGCSIPLILRRITKTCKEARQVGETASSTTGPMDIPDETGYAPLSECNHGVQTIYRLVGDGYVDGIMHGEALTNSSVKSRTIIIR